LVGWRCGWTRSRWDEKSTSSSTSFINRAFLDGSYPPPFSLSSSHSPLVTRGDQSNISSPPCPCPSSPTNATDSANAVGSFPIPTPTPQQATNLAEAEATKKSAGTGKVNSNRDWDYKTRAIGGSFSLTFVFISGWGVAVFISGGNDGGRLDFVIKLK
jgi:hypothetical protein